MDQRIPGPGFKKPTTTPSPNQLAVESNTEALGRKKERLLLLERKIQLQEGLPFLYGWKWYDWAYEFYESTSKINLLCAANQISKSSTQIRKCINWATNQALWPSLWKHRPNQFWYLYPTGKQVMAEWETKWKLFLPSGKYKTEKELDFGDGLGLRVNPYHWHEVKILNTFAGFKFPNTGVIVYFKTYAQDTQNLQTGTVDAMFCDEELPLEHFDELMFRLTASDGYFHMVFTATLGQDFWRVCMEPEDHEEETLPMARKWTVSMYQCQTYMDGTLSHWTDEKIEGIKARCQNHNEILKRVYGRFIIDRKGLKYSGFDIKKNMLPEHKLPSNWLVYEGVDIGSGGTAHKAAICFVAVSPDFKKGRVFLGWRGDGVITTAGDVFDKHMMLKGERGLNPTLQAYDWQSRDFFTIASRNNEPFSPADKDHARGEQIINTLFKSGMLHIYDTPELRKLATELISLKKETSKQKAKDDLCDALRYAVTRIPWDWGAVRAGGILGDHEKQDKELSPQEIQLAERRKRFAENAKEEYRIQDEFNEWNEAAGCGGDFD